MDVSSQTMEDFWGAALTKNNKELEWEVEDGDDDSLYTEKTLELRQACLGVGAKEGERNVIEITTENEEGNKVSHTILSLRVGGAEQSNLFVTLKPPVTFKLAEGNGPVHIVGLMTETIDLSMLNDDEEESDEEESEEEAVQEKVVGTTKMLGSNKRPAGSPLKAPTSKVPKLVAKEDDDENENSSEEGEEDDFSDVDMSDEDEDEEDEEDNESEEEVKPPPKKTQPNGRPKPNIPQAKGKLGTAKTPQTTKPQKGQQQKGSKSLPNTPKTAAGSEKKAKKTPGGKGAPDLNEIKEKLTKMSVPKKMEKFNNFVSNNFKIKDSSTAKQLWEFVQKNRAEK